MNWISNYTVEYDGDTKHITGDFQASAGSFKVEYTGDRGNSDTCIITLSGGQYEDSHGNLTEIKIQGCWEIHEVAELLNLIINAQ